MGLVYQHIRLANAARPDLEELDANALVDTGAADLCIPELVAKQLRLEKVEERMITVADGRQIIVDYVGPIRVEVFGRTAFTGGMVTGNQVLLGAIPMESMDVLVDPRRQQLIPNPAHPNIPGAMAVGVVSAHKDEQ
ncbi:clan AA aspartic protease [Sphingomonas sp. MMS24-J45]|uniref:clan AA aspartic protease n=1 Tax=Sphingomonas sp. MMS24-J45 TaxID=3238806 RepID=UPI00384D10E2